MIKHNSTSLNFISKRIKKKTKISLQKTATRAKYALLSFSAQPNKPMTTQEIKDEILAKIQVSRARDVTVRYGELQTVWGLKNKLPVDLRCHEVPLPPWRQNPGIAENPRFWREETDQHP